MSFGEEEIGDEEAWSAELERRLRDAVRIRLRSDVPVGIFLSGGLDSSAVAALASQVSSRPIKTFSVGFQEPDFDELKYARQMADRYGTDHQEIIVRDRDASDVDGHCLSPGRTFRRSVGASNLLRVPRGAPARDRRSVGRRRRRALRRVSSLPPAARIPADRPVRESGPAAACRCRCSRDSRARKGSRLPRAPESLRRQPILCTVLRVHATAPPSALQAGARGLCG